MSTYTNAPIHRWELSSPSLLRERFSRSTHHASTHSSLSLSSFSSSASDCPRIPCELEGNLPNGHVRIASYYELKESSAHFWPSSLGSESDKPTSHGQADTCPRTDTRFSVNPRRTSAVRSGGPPSLIRQGDRKGAFVENLVENATRIVEAIWPTSSTSCRTQAGSSNSSMLPLFTFVQETLRRSRTSYSTLQVALYYLVLIKPHVPPPEAAIEQQTDGCLLVLRALQCGRRMFLAALILASKYLQDRNYSARAWSKISGLPVDEINQNEMAFLNAVRWKLHIAEEAYQRWAEVIMEHMQSSSHSRPPSPSGESAASHIHESRSDNFKRLIIALNPDLDNLDKLLRVEASWRPLRTPVARAESLSPVPLFMPSGERSFAMAGSDYRVPRVLRPSLSMPAVLEPELVTIASEPHRIAAPALGLLPTPHLTPVGARFNTPAASFASSLPPPYGSCPSVRRRQAGGGFAPTLSRSDCAHPPPLTLSHTASPPSPRSFSRRPSMAISAASIVSSPESLVSDSSSVFSFSSTVSSAASSVAGAPIVSLDDPARARYGKQWSDGMSLRSKGQTSHRSFEYGLHASSPLGPAEESADGAAGRSAHEWNGSGCDRRVRGMTRNAHSFVQLPRQSYFRFGSPTTTTAGAAHSVPPKAGLKRPSSIANLVQNNICDLRERYPVDGAWSEAMLCAPPARRPGHPLACDPVDEGRKRVCFAPGTLSSCALASRQTMPSVCHVG